MKKTTSYALSIALSISLLAPLNTTVEAESFYEPQYESPISILLGYSSFQKPSYSFTITGDYSVKGKGDLKLTNGTYTINKNNNSVELIQGGTILHSDTEMTLFPINYDRNQSIKLGSYNFLGSMTFRINGNNILPVNTLEHEDYLLGVVAAEMSDSWGNNGGIEALKAQAITARTYSNGDKGKEIDNGQSYQVYNGYNSNYNNVRNAVDSTRKQIIVYNGNSIDKNAVFSSSNGGMMISKINSWGTASWNDIPYLVRQVDNFDSRSASSNTNWEFSLNKTQIDLSGLDLTTPETWWPNISENSSDNSKISSLKNFIKRYETKYKNHELKILSIDDLDFTQHSDNPNSKTPLNGYIKISYIAYDPSTNSYIKNEDGTIQIQTFEKSTRTYDYYLYNAFGSNTIKSPNIKNVSLINNIYTIVGGGWGHGIGLSQWGAYQRSIEGEKVGEIISFYYPGTTLTSFVPKDTDGGTPTPSNPSQNIENVYHTVISGDTLYSISRKYGTTVDNIKTLNNLSSNTIHVGQKLIVKQNIIDSTEPNPEPINPPNEQETDDTPVIDVSYFPKYEFFPSDSYECWRIKKDDLDKKSAHRADLLSRGLLESSLLKLGMDNIHSETGKLLEFNNCAITEPVILLDLNITDSINTQEIFYGKYTVNEKSLVSVKLNGPNGYEKLTFLNTVEAGTYAYGGPISQAPVGNYTVTITATANGQSITKTISFSKRSGAKLNVSEIETTSTTFLGDFSVDQKSTISIYLDGPNFKKFIYYDEVNSGSHKFGGPLLNSFPNGLYTITVIADNGIEKTTVTKNFNINRGTATSIDLKDFSFNNGVYYGTYTIDKNSLVAVSLLGPNGLQRLTFYQTVKPGTYAYAGNINSFPKGDYSVIITATNEYGIKSSVTKKFSFGQTSSSNSYTVKSGDTLYSISRKFSVSVDSLVSWNQLKTTTLKIGQSLIVKK